jgi:hypothetical protein
MSISFQHFPIHIEKYNFKKIFKLLLLYVNWIIDGFFVCLFVRGYFLTFMIAYLRDLGFQHGFIAESFETSVPWSRTLELCLRVKARIKHAVKSLNIPYTPFVSCRVTQVLKNQNLSHTHTHTHTHTQSHNHTITHAHSLLKYSLIFLLI